MRQKLMEFLRKRGPLVLFGLGAVVVLFFVSRSKGATETVARAVTGTLTGQNVHGLSYIQFGTQPRPGDGGGGKGGVDESGGKVKAVIGTRPTEGIPGGEVSWYPEGGVVASENPTPELRPSFRPPTPAPQPGVIPPPGQSTIVVSANPSAMRYTRGWEFGQ